MMREQRFSHNTLLSSLIFLHIQKTGGRTFGSILHKNYGKDKIRRISGVGQQREFESLPEAEKRQYQVLEGHFYFGIHEHLSQPYSYLTILRDPIQRMISVYFFVRERPTHAKYELMQTPLDVLLTKEANGLPSDVQTRMLSGVHNGELCTPEMLEKAKYNLANHFTLVGLTERFDETLMMAKRKYNWSSLYYYRRNESSRPRLEELPESVLSLISEHNQFDLQLYDFAKQLFEEQLRQQPPSFQSEIETFQRINKLYGTPFYVARFLKRKLRRWENS